MAAAARKFTFDLDLGARPEQQTSISDAALATMMADARTAGYAEGVAAGEQSAMAAAVRRLADAAASLADRVGAMTALVDDSRRATLSDAVGLAAAIGRKLAATLVDRLPTAEIETLIAECLASLDGVPHLVIRCHPDLADAVRETATGRMSVSGFTGRLIVMGDPDQALGDCRIEWVDGGLVRDQAAISAEIDNRIAAFLAARGINPVDAETREAGQ